MTLVTQKKVSGNNRRTRMHLFPFLFPVTGSVGDGGGAQWFVEKRGGHWRVHAVIGWAWFRRVSLLASWLANIPGCLADCLASWRARHAELT